MAFWQWMGLAVTAAVLCLLVRQQQPQLGGLCAAAAGVMLLLAALEQLADVREVFARLTGMAGIEEGYLNTLVKVEADERAKSQRKAGKQVGGGNIFAQMIQEGDL